VPEPQAGPGQVKVRVEWCGICGTDLHEYLDGPIFRPAAGAPHPLTGEQVPVCLGHEFAGVVADLGDGVSGFVPGDRVVVEPCLTCGTCARCREAATTSATSSASSGCPAVGAGSASTSSPTRGGPSPSATSAPTPARWWNRWRSRTTPSG
jgi:(R,R)-butanediol dehydrogenase/meso-butanediol dehydrogenase/diacetyl reductase